MFKKIGIIFAAMAAIAVVFVGANTYAGDGCKSKSSKTAYSGSCSAVCGSMKASDKASCAQICGSQMTSNTTETRSYYGANVYEVRDGHQYAVYEGRKFEVTDQTPYTQVGDARYYFADDACKISCTQTMAAKAPVIDRETVALATTDGNVVKVENGHKIARCTETGKEFEVTDNTPAKVKDGKRYYYAMLEKADNAH